MTPETASAQDRPALARMLARAFHEDPVACWSLPHEHDRPRRLARFFGIHLDTLLPHGLVLTTPGRDAAALWAPPDKWAVSARESLRFATVPRPWRIPLLGAGFGGVEAYHPRTPPHLYLAVLGVDADRQGQGMGSALLRPTLERCDREDLPAYLESSNERNVPLYERHGFRVTRRLRLPFGPPVWLMWREPRP